MTHYLYAERQTQDIGDHRLRSDLLVVLVEVLEATIPFPTTMKEFGLRRTIGRVVPPRRKVEIC